MPVLPPQLLVHHVRRRFHQQRHQRTGELLPSQTDKENGSSECNTHSMTTTAAYEMTVLHVPSNVQRLGTKALPGYCKAQPH